MRNILYVVLAKVLIFVYLLESVLVNVMFMGPRVVILCQYTSNNMQLYTVYFICKLLYMYRVVSPPIIKSTNKFVSCVLLLVLSCLLCNCCWLAVCIVVVVLRVLLSYYVYLLYCVGIAFFLL